MKGPRESLSLTEARRIALAAQGFARARPARVGAADVVRTVRALGLLQIDSVNVLVRSHYLPLYSRLGAYRAPLLDEAAYAGTRRRLFEYWGHEASLLPVESQPNLRWRMARARANFTFLANMVWPSAIRMKNRTETFFIDLFY